MGMISGVLFCCAPRARNVAFIHFIRPSRLPSAVIIMLIPVAMHFASFAEVSYRLALNRGEASLSDC